jgi:hypothetical protein
LGKDYFCNQYPGRKKFYLENLKGKDYQEDAGIYGKNTIKISLEEIFRGVVSTDFG